LARDVLQIKSECALLDDETVLATVRQTAEMFVNAGFKVVPLSIRKFAKLDAGSSCLSLGWHA